jgi:hypothetical protein
MVVLRLSFRLEDQIVGEAAIRETVIVTDDNNHLFQYFHGPECDRLGDDQGIHDHLGMILNEFLDLADFILSCSAQGPVCWWSRVVSRLHLAKHLIILQFVPP